MQQNIKPALRFAPFEEEWISKKLGAVLTIGNGKDYRHLKKGAIPAQTEAWKKGLLQRMFV